MENEVRKKFFNHFNLPDDLTLEKISTRATDFRESEDGEIKFDMIRHLPLLGRPNRGNVSPARWHVSNTYTYDPSSQKWDVEVNDVEFHYDIPLLVEEELIYLKRSGKIRSVVREEDSREDMVEELIKHVIQHYEEVPEAYEIEDEEWEEMIRKMIEELEPKLKERVDQMLSGEISSY